MIFSIARRCWASVGLIALTTTAHAQNAQSNNVEKLADDPTKVITQFGLRITNTTTTLQGSIAVGPVNKINASVSENEEWRIGASHLFPFGIVNVAGSRRLLSGQFSTQYSIGTFVPLNSFGFAPGGWQFFPTAGYNYSEGTNAVYDEDIGDFVSVPVNSDSVYIGVTTLKPINSQWTFGGGIVGVKGTNDYSGYSAGLGFTFAFTERDNFSAFASYTDNSFGTREVFGVGYRREF